MNIKKNLLYVFLTLFVLILMVVYASRHLDSFRKILEIKFYQVGFLSFLHLLMMVINTLVLACYLRDVKKETRFFDLFGVTALNSFFNNIITRSGLFVKGYLLKKQYNFPYTYFFSTALSFTLIQIIGAGLVGIFSILAMFIYSGTFHLLIFLVFVFVTTACIAIITLPFTKRIKDGSNWFMLKIHQLLESWRQINKDKGLLFKLILLSVLGYLIVAARIKYCFHVTGNDLGYAECLLFSSITILTSLFTLTPDALGIREFLIGTTYKFINGNMVEAFVAMTIDRMVAISILFIFGSIFSMYFLLKLKKL